MKLNLSNLMDALGVFSLTELRNGRHISVTARSMRSMLFGPNSAKRVIGCPAGLKADLDRYAALHAQTYGEAVDAVTLIPHMLEAFIAGDRGVRKGSVSKTVPPKPG